MADIGVSQCAVPHCTNQWHKMGEGKLFIFHVHKKSAPAAEIVRAWLCEDCFEDWQVSLDSQGRAVVYPAVHTSYGT